MGMKSSLGEWTEEEIAFNRPTLLGNMQSLDEDDMNALVRRLYNRDDSVFMGRQCQLRKDGRVSEDYCWSVRPGFLGSLQERVRGWVHYETGWIYGSRAMLQNRAPQLAWLEDRLTEERGDSDGEEGERAIERRRKR